MSARASKTPFVLSPLQASREHAISLALWLDLALIALIFSVAVLSGSLTMFAESVRTILMWVTEFFSLIALRRIHRGQLTELEFGSGKLEQLANLFIALGMLLGALWICSSAIDLIFGERPHGTPFGLAMAAIIGALNTYLNFVSWLSVRNATRAAPSVIMDAQLRARFVKLFSSGVVQVLLTVSALFSDPGISGGADILGSLFVAGFMSVTAWQMIRGGLPDLLDRTVDETVQQGINRALVRHFDDYERLDRVRSRRSGKVVFVEVALSFSPSLTLGEVDQRVYEIKRTLNAAIDHADVSVLVSSTEGPEGGSQTRAPFFA
ncbi:MAG: cation transporter [Verrucomicrobiota bacterium]